MVQAVIFDPEIAQTLRVVRSGCNVEVEAEAAIEHIEQLGRGSSIVDIVESTARACLLRVVLGAEPGDAHISDSWMSDSEPHPEQMKATMNRSPARHVVTVP